MCTVSKLPRKNLQCLLGWRKNVLRVFGILSGNSRRWFLITNGRRFHVCRRMCNPLFPEFDNPKFSDTCGPSIIFIKLNTNRLSNVRFKLNVLESMRDECPEHSRWENTWALYREITTFGGTKRLILRNAAILAYTLF